MSEKININLESDPFGLRKVDFRQRIPEKSEMFSREEALTYIHGCDFPESVDDLLLAWEIKDRFSNIGIENMHILDAMCGPGRLGRELLTLDAGNVTFHDGDTTMMAHAIQQAAIQGRRVEGIISPVNSIPIPDNSFDLVVCHNSTHQLASEKKLRRTLDEFLRVTKPSGFIFVADYQRSGSAKFLEALEERLMWTKPEIVPLLVPTFTAAFSKEEFHTALASIPDAKNWLVTDATLPTMTQEMRRRADLDPVKGHLLDFSPISLRAIAQKGGV